MWSAGHDDIKTNKIRNKQEEKMTTKTVIVIVLDLSKI